MSTGATFVDFGEKRLLGNGDFDDRMLAYLRTLVAESYEKSFRTGVVYDVALTLSGAGANAFSIGGTSQATDGLGHLLDIAASGFAAGITFENASAIDYQVALHFATVPDGIQVNPRKGFPQYIGVKEFVGESADPSTVVDNGSTITFGVDSVAEANVSHAGRTVRVFKKIPGKNATAPSIAIEDVTVVFTGTVNEITTTGVLGQEAPNSTTPADYTVVMLGPTVRRNTVLLGLDGYAFLGIVTGVGTGGTPVTFNTVNQDVINMSLSDLADITSRKSVSDRLRIDVKSFASDVGQDQIIVRNPAGTPVFQVDGNGNVTIAGTTTQQDLVQVNSSETITDNLTAGDNDAVDSHLIRGQWKHTNNAATANYFFVDGATGRIGINQVAEASISEGLLGQVAITGDVRHLGSYRVQSSTLPNYQLRDTSLGVTAGGLWRILSESSNWTIQENTAADGTFSTGRNWFSIINASDRIQVDGDFTPRITAVRDLGLVGQQWRDGFYSRDLSVAGIATIGELVLGTGAGQGVGSNFIPDSTNVRDLGSLVRRYAETHTRDLYLGTTLGEGVHTDLMPDIDSTRDFGSPTQRWANVFTLNLNFTGDFLPSADNVQDIGSPTFRWAEGHYSNIVKVGDTGLFISGVDFQSLGTVTLAGAGDNTAVNIDRTYSGDATAGGPLSSLNLRHRNAWTVGSASTTAGIQLAMQHDAAGGNDIDGVRVTLTGNGGSTVGFFSGFHVRDLIGTTTATRVVGLRIGDITSASATNYAILTGLGLVEFGGSVRPAASLISDFGSNALRWRETFAGFLTASATVNRPIFVHAGFFQATVAAPGTTDNSVVKVDARYSTLGSGTNNKGLDVDLELLHSVGTLAIANAVSALCNPSASGGTTTNAFAFNGLLNVGAGHTVSEGGGIQIGSPIINGTVTNSYGLRIQNQTGAVNSFAIRTQLGIVEFGDIVRPNATATHDLGSLALQWRDHFNARTVSLHNININGASAGSSAIQQNSNVGTGSIALGFTARGILLGTNGLTGTGIKAGGTFFGVGTATALTAIEVQNVGTAAGTVTTSRGIRIISQTLGTIGTNIGLDITGFTIGVQNFAIRTAAGIVQFGDRVQPSTNNLFDLGVSVAQRWRRVFCDTVHALSQPATVFRKLTTQVFTAVWATVPTWVTASTVGMTATPATGVILALKAGRYLITYTMPVGLVSTSDTVMQARALRNNSVVIDGSYSRHGTNTAVGKGTLNASFVTTLAANDDVRIQIQERTDIDGVPASFGSLRDSAVNSIANLGFSVSAIALTGV